MAPQTQSRKRGTASERVLEAATRLLIEDRGHLEIDSLAAAAGCSTGAIYHNFGSKAGILSAVIGRYNQEVGAVIAPGLVPDARDAWLAEMRDAVDATVAFMWKDPLTPVIVQETIRDASAAAETERWLRLHVSRLAAHLTSAQAAGHLAGERDPAVLAAGLAGGMRQIMRVFMERPLVDLDTIRRETWDFVARLVDADLRSSLGALGRAQGEITF